MNDEQSPPQPAAPLPTEVTVYSSETPRPQDLPPAANIESLAHIDQAIQATQSAIDAARQLQAMDPGAQAGDPALAKPAETSPPVVVKPPEEKKKQTCRIGQVLPASVIELLKAAPQNDTIRAVILAHLRVPIPDDALTFEQIRTWIEHTIKSPQFLTEQGIPVGIPGVDSVPPAPMVMIPIKGTEDEMGSCRYCVTTRGQGNYQIGLDAFRQMVEESDDLDELQERVSDEVGEDWYEYISLEIPSNATFETYDREPDHHGECDWEFNCAIRDHLRNLVAAHAPAYSARMR